MIISSVIRRIIVDLEFKRTPPKFHCSPQKSTGLRKSFVRQNFNVEKEA